MQFFTSVIFYAYQTYSKTQDHEPSRSLDIYLDLDLPPLFVIPLIVS